MALLRTLWERHRQLGRFVLVGLCNTALSLGTIYGCKFFFGAGDVLANVLGYVAGITLSFTLNSRWTFEYRGPRLPAVARFLLVCAVAYVANLATVMGLIHFAGVNSYLAHAAGMPVYTLIFYVLSRAYVFRHARTSLPQTGSGGSAPSA